jgi:hypothetical protein
MKRFASVVALGLLALLAQPSTARAESVLRYGISLQNRGSHRARPRSAKQH